MFSNLDMLCNNLQSILKLWIGSFKMIRKFAMEKSDLIIFNFIKFQFQLCIEQIESSGTIMTSGLTKDMQSGLSLYMSYIIKICAMRK